MFYISIFDENNRCIDKMMNLTEEEAKGYARVMTANGGNCKVYNYDFVEINF